MICSKCKKEKDIFCPSTLHEKPVCHDCCEEAVAIAKWAKEMMVI